MFIKKFMLSILIFIILFNVFIIPISYGVINPSNLRYKIKLPISYSETPSRPLSYNYVEQAITFAKGEKQYYKGYCQKFIQHIWTNSISVPGVTFSSRCCANQAYLDFVQSKSRTDIPEGASVFFKKDKKHQNDQKNCSWCGNKPGHVGFYIGDNQVIHCYTGGKVCTNSIDEIVKDGYTYLGWGYHSNVKLERKPLESCPQNKNKSTLSINLDKLPENLEYGKNFGLHGQITSNYPITSVTGLVRCDNITLFSTCDTPCTTSLNIKDSDLNNKITFGTLPVGKYTLIIIAEDLTTKKVSLTQEFIIKPVKSTLKINLTSKLDLTNNIHSQGKNLGLYGSITSNYNIVRIGGYILQPKSNSNTLKVIQSTDNTDIRYHNTKEVNINKSNLNNDLLFKPLEPGDYILQIYAVDSSGKTQTLNKTFTVVPNGNSNIVTGTVVNLSNLGWKNLSIRTGPSTNYKIIGSMTSGKKCTINLSKSTTNWYYIEYNGIKGYASKKGISL